MRLVGTVFAINKQLAVSSPDDLITRLTKNKNKHLSADANVCTWISVFPLFYLYTLFWLVGLLPASAFHVAVCRVLFALILCVFVQLLASPNIEKRSVYSANAHSTRVITTQHGQMHFFVLCCVVL